MILYDNEKVVVAPWVSTHTYFYGKENSRTYISNERLHTYLQLDGLSSDLWYIITQENENEFLKIIKDNNLQNDVKGFLDELKGQGLLFDDKIRTEILNQKKEIFSNSDEDKNFILERNDWLRKNHFLVDLFFELTYRCNLKCIHCYNPKNQSNIEIPFDKIKSIIDEAYDLGCLSVTISGGESTTYSHFVDIIKYIRNKKMGLEIFTNGQLLYDNADMYNEIIRCYPHQVCLSLYSMNESIHEKVTCVRGSYKKTKSIIEKLRKNGIAVQIKNFLLNINSLDCIEVKDFGLKVGANVLADLSLIPTIEGDKKTHEYLVGEKELFELFTNKESPLYLGKDPYIFDIKEHCDESLCLGGFNGVCISPTLDVNICVSMPMPVGNLKDDTLTGIWLDSFDCKTNKLCQWKHTTCDELQECYKHDYCRFCHYCAGMGLLENGYLKKSNVLCLQAKVKQKAYNYLNLTK